MTKKQFDKRLHDLMQEASEGSLDPLFAMAALESAKLAIFCSIREQRLSEAKLSQHMKGFVIKLPPTHEEN